MTRPNDSEAVVLLLEEREAVMSMMYPEGREWCIFILFPLLLAATGKKGWWKNSFMSLSSL